MKRRDFLTGLAAAAAVSGPALAQDYVASVVAQLESMGFGSIRQERTLLGRIRIIAVRGDGRREIIINPNNGEILRDLWTPRGGGQAGSDLIGDKPGSGGTGGTGDGDDDEDSEGGDDDSESGGGDDDGGDDGGDDDGGSDDDDDDGGGDDDDGDDDDGDDDDGDDDN